MACDYSLGDPVMHEAVSQCVSLVYEHTDDHCLSLQDAKPEAAPPLTCLFGAMMYTNNSSVMQFFNCC